MKLDLIHIEPAFNFVSVLTEIIFVGENCIFDNFKIFLMENIIDMRNVSQKYVSFPSLFLSKFSNHLEIKNFPPKSENLKSNLSEIIDSNVPLPQV